jgi:hypothetical protein
VEVGQGFAELTLGGVAEAMDAGDGGLVDEGVAGPGGVHLVHGEVLAGGVPGFGFDPAVAAEHPFEVDEGVDEGALAGGGGLEFVGVSGFEGGEFFGGLGADDDAAAVEAGLDGVLGGGGLSLGGAGAGGLLRIAAIRFDLGFGRHAFTRSEL